MRRVSTSIANYPFPEYPMPSRHCIKKKVAKQYLEKTLEVIPPGPPFMMAVTIAGVAVYYVTRRNSEDYPP
jgi:hypothetical protein